MAGALVLASTGGVVGVASRPASADASMPFPTMSTCTIQTFTGNYLTAVDGGGHTGLDGDALHTDATTASGGGTFTVVNIGNGQITIQTPNENYVTAVGGGGLTTDAIRTDATTATSTEAFTPVPIAGQPAGVFGIQTGNGDYLTAVGGGGRSTDVIHTDATVAQGWEWFTFACNTPDFDPRNCTNMQYCWTDDVNGDGVMDSIGIMASSTPFTGMANVAVVDYSNAGHPQNFGTASVENITTEVPFSTCILALSFPQLAASQKFPGTGALAVVGFSAVNCFLTEDPEVPHPVASLAMTFNMYLNNQIVATQTRGNAGMPSLRAGGVLDPCRNGGYRISAQASVVFAEPNSDPPGGTIHDDGATLNYNVCEKKTPNFGGLSQSSAGSAIQAATLVVGSITTQPSDQPIGTVVAQNPPANASIPYGGTVDLVLSNGNAGVPPVLGDEEADAVTAIEDAGLVASVSHVADCNSPGDVETQNPSAGARALRGDTVSIRVSTCTTGGGVGGGGAGGTGGTGGGTSGGGSGGQASSGSGGPILPK